MVLHYSSLLFGIVSAAGQGTWICPAFTTLMGLSIINHSVCKPNTLEKRIVRGIDMTLAHVIYAVAIKEAFRLSKKNSYDLRLLGFWKSSAYTILAWLSGITRIPGIYGEIAHASIHLSGSIGMLLLMRAGGWRGQLP